MTIKINKYDKICMLIYRIQLLLPCLYYPVGGIIDYFSSRSYTLSECFNYGSLGLYLCIISIGTIIVILYSTYKYIKISVLKINIYYPRKNTI